MGAFSKLFKKNIKADAVQRYFQMLDGYSPIFSSYDGGVYEMELTRACIHTFATHSSKLMPSVTGADLQGIRKILERKPNFAMTSSQFLYKVATISEAQTTCFIAPVLNEKNELIGYYPVNPLYTELVDYNGTVYLRYTFCSGEKAAVELDRCGIINKYLYSSDIRGEGNEALTPTMQLLSLQNKGIEEGIKNGASFRFYATMGNFAKAEDLKRERENFTKSNLSSDSNGLLLFPNTYSNINQVNSTPKLVDAEQMALIQTRVFNYFGSSEEIVQNKAFGDLWSAYYEGKIEPFAIQLSQAMTSMTYTAAELDRGNGIVWSSNRLQYATTSEKLQVSTQMFDRGIMSTNQIMDIWNLPHVENGDARYIRREYTEISKLNEGDLSDTGREDEKQEPSTDENADGDIGGEA